MGDEFSKGLQELCILYAKTKGFILRAEQNDPESRSNIAIFKEQRDALDHVMRGLTAYLNEENSDAEYLKAQVDKAKGHLFRAAYDALDGVGISCKLRIKEAMEGVSLEAIAAVYEEYYDHIAEIDDIDDKIIEHRKAKDVKPTTLQNLEAYFGDIDRMCTLAREASHRRPAFNDWNRRNRKKTWVWILAVPAVFGIFTAGLKFAGDYYLKSVPQAVSTPASGSTAAPGSTPRPWYDALPW